MGKVFLAKDIKTGRSVAVKVVKDYDQWEREAEILKRLRHVKGVPDLFFAGEDEEIFLVMEYISGDSLKKYVKIHGKLSEKDMIVWILRVCGVLRKIHKKGVVHMDLKPENIIIHPSGRLYLIDYGVSLMEGESLKGYGTKVYASKRQRRSGGKAEFSMDIYSMGKIIQLNMKNKRTKSMKKIIRKCLDEEINNYGADELKRDLKKILWEKRVKKSTLFFICFSAISGFYLKESKEQNKQVQVCKNRTQEEIKTAMLYFYGSDQTEKNLAASDKHFRKLRTNSKRIKAYRILLDVLRERGDVAKNEFTWALKICQKDIYDFWSAYFFEHHYILWSEKLPEEFLKEADKIIQGMTKFPMDHKKQKLLCADKISLYEIMAEKGDTKLFFEETDKVFRENFSGEGAWELYERKLSYLMGQNVDMEKEFERFIKHYPKVMEAYIEYGIYLCQREQMEKARKVYQEGYRQTGMTSRRAQGLRRKLGL